MKAGHAIPAKVVLAATDFSDVNRKAVKEGLWVAQQSGAEFHMLHIIDSKDVPEDLISNIPEGRKLTAGRRVGDNERRRAALKCRRYRNPVCA